MKCPHCQVEVHDSAYDIYTGNDRDGGWRLLGQNCPACERVVIAMTRFSERDLLLYPRGSIRPRPPAEVPEEFAQDYVEAALVLTDSAKASAALSRRCLQHVLREAAGVKQSNLFAEIQEIVNSGKLPSYLSTDLDAIRNIGNFAAHPMKSTSSGEVLDVEPGEAEWNLDVLDRLFDFYFVQPALAATRRAALNSKLTDAGKTPIK